MRILVSSGIFPNAVEPTRGIYIYKQVEALRRRCDVAVVAPVAQYPPGLRRGPEVPESSEFDGLRVAHPRYIVVPKLRFLHGPAVIRGSLEAHRQAIESLRPDVVLTFFAYPYGYAGVEIARRFGIPALVGVLGSDVNVKARSPMERPLIRRTFERAQRVLCVSAALAREVEGIGIDPGRIVVIPNGVDERRFRPMDRREARAELGIDGNTRVIGCVSRLSHEKGIDILLRAVARMETPNLRVNVIGHGAEHGRLVGLAAELGVSNRVDFVGMKPHNEVPVWIAASDVMVLPSRIEGHPNAVLEAMACGRPVVGARVGGVGEAIASESLGLLVPPEDPAALAETLERALAREWDTDAIVSAGTRRTWDTVADELLAVIGTVLGQDGRSS